jgi:hypothetical protein
MLFSALPPCAEFAEDARSPVKMLTAKTSTAVLRYGWRDVQKEDARGIDKSGRRRPKPLTP